MQYMRSACFQQHLHTAQMVAAGSCSKWLFPGCRHRHFPCGRTRRWWHTSGSNFNGSPGRIVFRTTLLCHPGCSPCKKPSLPTSSAAFGWASPSEAQMSAALVPGEESATAELGGNDDGATGVAAWRILSSRCASNTCARA